MTTGEIIVNSALVLILAPMMLASAVFVSCFVAFLWKECVCFLINAVLTIYDSIFNKDNK